VAPVDLGFLARRGRCREAGFDRTIGEFTSHDIGQAHRKRNTSAARIFLKRNIHNVAACYKVASKSLP